MDILEFSRKAQILLAILILFLLVIMCVSVHASNVADVTNRDRYEKSPIFKIAYTEEMREGYINFPIGKFSDVVICTQQDGDNQYRSTELKFIAKLLPETDVSFSVKDANSTAYHFIAVDFHPLIFPFNFVGVGARFPLEKGEKIQAGCRLILPGDVKLFFSRSEENFNSFGLTYAPEFFKFEGSVTRDILSERHFNLTETWEAEVRVSKSFDSPFGVFIPEVRIKTTKPEDYYGVGLSFIPKWE